MFNKHLSLEAVTVKYGKIKQTVKCYALVHHLLEVWLKGVECLANKLGPELKLPYCHWTNPLSHRNISFTHHSFPF
jgi:hypothetical protein